MVERLEKQLRNLGSATLTWFRPAPGALRLLLTLGLFFFVVNALMLLLTSWVSDQFDLGFHVRGFWTAVIGSIVISVVSWAAGLVLPKSR